MLKKVIITVTVLSFFTISGFIAAADDPGFMCSQLNEKATGDLAKYSLYGEADGPLFFSGISCAIEHRNRVLCAMEMVSFDNSAKVHDYFTAEEINIAKAYFWLDETKSAEPIPAFSSKEAAEKFRAEKGRGAVVEYSGLLDRFLK